MSVLELVVADALVATDFAPELVRELTLPNLTIMAAQADETAAFEAPDGALLTEWQAWALRHDPEATFASLAALAAGLPVRPTWRLEPVHFEVGHDAVLLTDASNVSLPEADARALALAVEPLFRDAGFEVAVSAPTSWFASRDTPLDWRAPDAACALYQNVALWMPRAPDPSARLWRRLANEVQMTWFEHPVNAAREAAGMPAVNALWLSGTGKVGCLPLPYASVTSDVALLADAPRAAHAENRLETFLHLTRPARTEDWSAWRNALQALDVRVGECLRDLRAGRIASLEMILTGDGRTRALAVRARDLWKFWRRGSPADLIAAPP